MGARVKARDRYRKQYGLTQPDVDALWPDITEDKPVEVEGAVPPSGPSASTSAKFACVCGRSYDRKSDLTKHANRDDAGDRAA